MTEHQAGMMVSQRAIDWWPYLAHMINRINDACEGKNPETFTDIFLDAGNLVSKVRRETTIHQLRNELKIGIRRYRWAVKDMVSKRRRIRLGRDDAPLKETTRRQFR
mgnify:CR=1 FL=1